MTGKRGRPPMGVTSVHVRLPVEELAVIDDIARINDQTRAEVIRWMLHSWLLDNGELR